ncbi:MAG: L-lysine 6-transaminase [Planctomycetota bacterium]
MSQISADQAHATLEKYLIADGLPMVFDYERSHGAWAVDGVTGQEYLDCYGFFASLPLGLNHPALSRPDNQERLARAAMHKPTNSDADSVEFAGFVEQFAREAMPAPFRHLFFIEGGALAVENALKAAFDWKVRKNLAAGRGELGTKILHFKQAFHGRSGYTMSLTNTLPKKVAYFPKFDWPRVSNPSLRFPIDEAEIARVGAAECETSGEIVRAFEQHPHDIAAIIIEPIQAEGGDHHFRPEFFAELRRLADEHEALLIFDEVQTGFGTTGKLWCWQHFGVVPDLVSFGKKTQVCGVMAGPRLDEVDDNVFQMSSRINSTWGGALVDMVRCQIIMDAYREERVIENCEAVGEHLLGRLRAVQEEYPALVSNVRGRGLMCAIDLPSGDQRDQLIDRCRENGLLSLACGDRSLRCRPALTLKTEEADEIAKRLSKALQSM